MNCCCYYVLLNCLRELEHTFFLQTEWSQETYMKRYICLFKYVQLCDLQLITQLQAIKQLGKILERSSKQGREFQQRELSRCFLLSSGLIKEILKRPWRGLCKYSWEFSGSSKKVTVDLRLPQSWGKIIKGKKFEDGLQKEWRTVKRKYFSPINRMWKDILPYFHVSKFLP